MNISCNDLLNVLSEALDAVEKEVLGVSDHHAKRIAWLSMEMGKIAKLNKNEISCIAIAALLHDNALNAMRLDYENGKPKVGVSGERHCLAGVKNVELIFEDKLIQDLVLYHHECANGSGPFKKLASEIHLGAEIVHLADQVDFEFNLSEIDNIKLNNIKAYLRENEEILFSKQVNELFLEVLNTADLRTISNENITQLDLQYNPIPLTANKKICELFARIIDYKSPFTKVHSIGVATKTEKMANYYKFDESHTNELYIAGALHDIGKLFVSNAVLEKNGRLDENEYKHIQNHAYETYRLLSKIKGFEEICDYASYHHEKLNGKGYPFGKKADDMNKEMRLLACIDIYQALTEDRPYKAGMPHQKAISILYELADKGELDSTIVDDINTVFDDGKHDNIITHLALFECSVCGHIYEGDELPYDYKCPVCNQPAHVFTRIK